jgi:hypothetical protein
VAADASGRFVVVWTSDGQDGSQRGLFGQRFLPDGTRAGTEFQVNSYTTGHQFDGRLLPAPDGGFVVVWRSETYTDRSVWSLRFDPSGSPQGAELRLVGSSGYLLLHTDAAASAAGDFVVVWDRETGIPPMGFDVRARRFDPLGAPRGQDFLVTEYPNALPDRPLTSVASDESGNLLAAWQTPSGDVYARRFGGLLPAGLVVFDGGNGVLEAADTFTLVTSWRNVNGAAQTFQGRASAVAAPAGMTLTLSPDADYGTVANGASGACTGPCFAGSLSGTRPTGHLDASLLERIAPDALGQSERWVLHVGDSFADVPRASIFYRFVETLLHHGVTGGCGATTYCPTASTSREEMAPFVLVAREGTGYAPPACGAAGGTTARPIR